MKRQNMHFVFTMWWFILCAVVGIAIVFFTTDRERISYDENRVLQNAPDFSLGSFKSGEYSEAFENFLSDSIPGRKMLIKMSDSILSCISANTSDDLYYLDTTEKDIEEFLNENAPDSAEESADDTREISTPNNGDAQSDGDMARLTVFLKDDKKVELMTYDSYAMTTSAANLDKLAQQLPDDGKVYFTTMSFPGVIRRYCNNFRDFTGWKSTLPEKMDQLTSDKVVCIDSYEALEPHILEGEDLFLHTNHQWNDRGAYYVFSKCMETQGLEPTPFDEYEYNVNTASYTIDGGGYDYYNLLYPLAPADNYIVIQSQYRQSVPFMTYNVASTMAYLNGQQTPWKTVETGFHTGRNALVLGDCFCLAVMPYLLPYYDEVHTTRLNEVYFDRKGLGKPVAQLIADLEIDDIYYISSESSGVNSKTLQYSVGVNLFK